MMHRLGMMIALGAAVLVASGCSNKLRVTRRLAPHRLGHYAGDGGVVIATKKKVCVAPPAQAATTVKLEVDNSAKAAVKEIVDATLSSKINRDETLSNLYEQGQATLFLQFMAYRLCEANLNGSVSDSQYLAELDKINARGEKLLELELKLAAARTAQAKAAAEKADADAKTAKSKAETETQRMKAFSDAVKKLDDPNVDDATREVLRESLPDLAAPTQ